MPFDLGDTVRLTAECRDPGGTLADAASVALTITLPDGSTVSPAVTNPPATTGQYSVDYATTAAGRHAVRWVFTTPGTAYTDAFDVREATPPLLLSLAAAKTHLRKSAASTTDDDEVRFWIEATTAAVEHFTGPVVRRAVTETHPDREARALVLHQIPALSLTSVTAVLTGGTDYDTSDLDLDGATGIVRRLDGGLLYGPLRVVYTAGREAIPANIGAAARIILQHLWRTRYGASRGAGAVGGGEDYSVTEPIEGLGYAIPNRALHLLEPHRLPPAGG